MSTPDPDKRSTPAILRVAKLNTAGETAFALYPDAEARAALAAGLDLSALRKLSFTGTLRPEGARDWRLAGTLGATVVQPCGVTLEPVTTRIDAPVERRFLAHMPEPESPEVEMPDDVSQEPLGDSIDLGAVMTEALALNLPLYPRKEGAELGSVVHAEPGAAPLTDEAARPFAGLAELRDKLKRRD